MQGLHPRTQQKSRRLKEEPYMHRQRKHRTYGVSVVCRKSAGIEKHTGSDSARSIRIPNVEEAPLQKHEDHRDRDGRDDGGRHHVTPVRRRLAEERHHKNGGQRHRIEQVWRHFMGGFLTRTAFAGKVEI